MNVGLGPKWLELLHQILPAAIKVAVLVNPSSPAIAQAFLEAIRPAASSFQQQLHVLEASTEPDIDKAFAALGQLRADARRYADSIVERLPDLAAELVKLKVDIIVAWSTPPALAAKQATRTIPIVAAVMADPVGDELVASLARPAGNITGTTFLGPELVSKRLQLLKEIIPGLSRVAALWQPHAYGEHTMASMSKEMEASARTLGMQIQFVPAASPDELANAFSAITNERPDAFILMPSPILYGQYGRIVAFAAKADCRQCIKRGKSWRPEASCPTALT